LVRPVQVCTVEWPRKRRTLKENLEQGLLLIEEAAFLKPDILCFPEYFLSPLPLVPVGSPFIDLSTASPIPGPITDAIGEKATQYNMYAICPMLEQDGDKFYNTAALIDRRGKVVGKYRKSYPTIDELKSGIRPGVNEEIFNTDFGKIGVLICFDIQYPPLVETLVREGAEIVFFPAEFPAQTYVRGIAWQYAVNVVSSIRELGSQIVDLTGQVVAQGGGSRGGRGGEEHSARDESYSRIPVIAAELNLDSKRFLYELDTSEKVRRISQKYGRQVEIRFFRPDDEIVISSISNEVTLDQIIREFGLETKMQYIQR